MRMPFPSLSEIDKVKVKCIILSSLMKIAFAVYWTIQGNELQRSGGNDCYIINLYIPENKCVAFMLGGTVG